MPPPFIYDHHATPFGNVYLLLDEQGLRQCSFSPIAGLDDTISDPIRTRRIAEQIGCNQASIPLYPKGTDFQHAVWRIVQTIPFGETRGYQWVADQLGQPRAVRAVANAIGANPIGWFIPCHRVIRTDGTLGGFGWGVELKHQLLDWEQYVTTRT